MLNSSIWFEIGVGSITLVITGLVFFFGFKTLAYVLKVLKEMEFNSRKKG